MHSEKKIDPGRLSFTFNLNGKNSACAVFKNEETNRVLSCNFTNYDESIGAMADALLRLIDVFDEYDGANYEQYLEEMIESNDSNSENNKKRYFYFESDITEYQFELEMLNEKYVRMKVFLSDHSTGRDEELVFEIDTDLYSLAKQVISQLELLLINYGFSGYYARWDEDFPLTSYLKLKSYIIINSSTGILKKQVPNLGIPYKIELKLLNKLTAVNVDESKSENIRRAG